MSTNPVLDNPMLEEEEEISPGPYEITASPNDFNIATLYSFITSGVVKIPGFQRHYVWDQKQASKLIESLLLGLPIPQIFLYEAARNSFLVLDGQQRLMSLYYFREGRFPRFECRAALRHIFDKEGKIPDIVLSDPKFFVPFTLKLPKRADGSPSEFQGLSYETLGERRTEFDIKTIRNVIIKQLQPQNDMSSVYEIFTRLNTEGVNLERQELRASLYHSQFLEMLGRVNELPAWRQLYGLPDPELHMRDIQILLRAFGLLSRPYVPSMVRFLDQVADSARKFKLEDNLYIEQLFASFLTAASELAADDLKGQGGAFSITLFEAIFVAACSAAYERHALVEGRIDPASVTAVANDADFQRAASYGTTSSANVKTRLDAGRRLLRMT